MQHELRAILDRFIYEHAGVRHLLFAAPPEADARVLPGTGWTTVQLVAHFASAQERYAAVTSRWLSDVGAISADELDPDESSARAEVGPAETARAAVLERYAASLRGLFDAFQQIRPGQLEEAIGPASARQVLSRWSEHQLLHIFPFVQALPETRYDPVIVNWLARTPVPNDVVRAQQQEYIADVREYYAHLAEDEGEPDD